MSTRTLDDLCDLIADSEHKTAPKDPEGSHPLVRTTDLGNARINLAAAQRVNGETYSKWTRRGEPRTDDLILAREAPVGGIGRVPDGVHPVLGQRTVLLQPGGDVDSRFLMYRLAAPDLQARMREMATGSTVPHLNMSDIREFEVPDVPDHSEQLRRAAVLAALDELIAINERRIELLEDLGRSLSQEWFVRFRIPGQHDIELVETEAGHIPSGWEIESLGSICSFIGAGSTPRRSDPTNWEDGTVEWFTTGELRDGPLMTAAERVVSKPRVRLFEPPMILMAIYGSPTVGRLGWVTATCSCNQAALGLRARRAPEAQEWLWFELLRLRSRFNAMSQGAAQQNISKEKVAKTTVVVPPPNVLARFAERAEPLREQSHTLHAMNATLASTRDLLLSRLVTGGLDISNVDLGALLPGENAA